ncbi:MAG TPA: hypothetical protein VKA00_00900 [Trueperaceae bacterium]|nr:hypothetical protein [Trueperaceae bacterium]
MRSLSPGTRGCGEHGLRIGLRRLRRTVELTGGALPAGALVIDLHLCNQRDPDAATRAGAARWAARMLVRYRRSCREIARRMREDPELAAVRGVGGVTAIFGGAGGHGGAGRLPLHLGFEVLPHPAALGAFGTFFQRLYAWGLLAAYAPGSLAWRRLSELGFIEVWMTREAFLDRFAPAGAPAAQPGT